ncbi:MAG: hypothetical protein DWQ36_14630 [Acidobacteria bacterium]|nr:MAG: hypothetical protein DWQ30_03365 [Acidobacteriota bacterium]REK06127.1 MAG: hypothetical protein DWQ36_14630 [Acidobacteriota bacterium]
MRQFFVSSLGALIATLGAALPASGQEPIGLHPVLAELWQGEERCAEITPEQWLLTLQLGVGEAASIAGDAKVVPCRHVLEELVQVAQARGAPVAVAQKRRSARPDRSVHFASAGASANRFGFTGHEMDPESGLIYMKGRYYDPGTGTFLSMDPFEGTVEAPQSLHRYNYAYSNPLVYVDPDGRCVGRLQGTRPCQAIAESLRYQIVGDPMAIADQEIERQILVTKGRRQFREETGRNPQPGEIVYRDGTRALTADYREIDLSGRIEADHAEYALVSAGVGTRAAVSSARAGGAGAVGQVTAGSAALADEAFGEAFGVSPGNVRDVAQMATRSRGPPSWSSSEPPPPRQKYTLVGESQSGPGVEFGDSAFAKTVSLQPTTETQVLSAFPRDRRVAGTRGGRRPIDPSPGLSEFGAFEWTPENVARMERGQPPVGTDGRLVQLHHRGQNPRGPLDELTARTHQQVEHPDRPTRIDRSQFAGERRRYWVERVRRAHGQGSIPQGLSEDNP